MQEVNENIELISYDKSKNFDYHVHIGQFYNKYYEPHKVIEVLKNKGLKGCWLSSLSSCLSWNNGNEKIYITNHIEDEVREALNTANNIDFDAKALYWVNLDEYLQVIESYSKEKNKSVNDISNNTNNSKNSNNINNINNISKEKITKVELYNVIYDYLIKRLLKICYFGFKIHTRFNYWDIKNENVVLIFNVVCDFAKKYNMPILIHCGPDECDSPRRFLDWFIKYSDVTFVLAHLRPAEDIVDIMKKFNNVWTDTAFANDESILFAYKEGVGNRVLYGSDYPINDIY